MEAEALPEVKHKPKQNTGNNTKASEAQQRNIATERDIGIQNLSFLAKSSSWEKS